MFPTWCTVTPTVRPSPGTTVRHSASVRLSAKAARFFDPCSIRSARASARRLTGILRSMDWRLVEGVRDKGTYCRLKPHGGTLRLASYYARTLGNEQGF